MANCSRRLEASPRSRRQRQRTSQRKIDQARAAIQLPIQEARGSPASPRPGFADGLGQSRYQ
jgi:hypothetical protein